MTQIATVERIIDHNHAIISVPRKSACGHDCEECAGCGISGTAIRAKAVNTVGATIGQKVVVESSTEKMLGIIALVYITPIVLFFIGYIATLLLNFSVAVQYTTALVGFVLGILCAVWYDRRLRDRGGLVFTIVRLF